MKNSNEPPFLHSAFDGGRVGTVDVGRGHYNVEKLLGGGKLNALDFFFLEDAFCDVEFCFDKIDILI